LKESERAKYTSDEDKAKSTGQKASLYVEQHGQSGLDILKSRTLKESERAKYTSDEDKAESIGQRASRHVD
jgi:hypothetical protein